MISAKNLNSDLEKISKCAFHWKCNLILIPINQQMKVLLLEKQKNSSNPPVAFNNNVIKKYPHHEHLGIVLNSKL